MNRTKSQCLTKKLNLNYMLTSKKLSLLVKKKELNVFRNKKEYIHKSNKNSNSIIFVAWGAFADNKLKNIDRDKHTVLVSSHPSPLSVYKKYKSYPSFDGSNPFSKINKILSENNLKEIDW